ncbi:TolC family protein [Runella salmonicolor]|uniref:TolC family protein n=1 Tax=Runella salmonicolor TaxID=2950278 RepID=A0ABT1FMW6_9BACT|nr:TolC family protein [Runella salmonicolor]MCP1383104.1 TolC family protein [Runella salmonicolor]
MLQVSKIRFAIIGMLFFALNASAQKTLTLRECVELLTKNNLTYRESQLQAQNAGAQLQQTRSQQLPQIGFSAGQNLNFGRSIDRFTNAYIDQLYNTNGIGLGFQVPLFQGFQIQHQVQQGIALRDAALKNQEAILNQQIIRVLQAYVQVLATKALYDAAQQQVASSQQQVDRVEKQVAAGTVGQNTLYEIKAQLANDKFDEVTARNNEQLAKLTLFQLMNIQPEKDVVLEPIADAATALSVTPAADAIYEEALKLFPEVKSSELRLSSFASQIRAVKANSLPSLNLSGNFAAFYASSNSERSYFKQLDATRNGSLSLGLNIPIMGRWQVRPRVDVVKAQQELARNQVDGVKQLLRQSIELAVQQLDATTDRYAAAQSQVESLQANFSAAESRLNAGTINVFEYTLAKANLARAQANAIRSRYEYALQRQIIEFYRKGKWEF